MFPGLLCVLVLVGRAVGWGRAEAALASQGLQRPTHAVWEDGGAGVAEALGSLVLPLEDEAHPADDRTSGTMVTLSRVQVGRQTTPEQRIAMDVPSRRMPRERSLRCRLRRRLPTATIPVPLEGDTQAHVALHIPSFEYPANNDGMIGNEVAHVALYVPLSQYEIDDQRVDNGSETYVPLYIPSSYYPLDDEREDDGTEAHLPLYIPSSHYQLHDERGDIDRKAHVPFYTSFFHQYHEDEVDGEVGVYVPSSPYKVEDEEELTDARDMPSFKHGTEFTDGAKQRTRGDTLLILVERLDRGLPTPKNAHTEAQDHGAASKSPLRHREEL